MLAMFQVLFSSFAVCIPVVLLLSPWEGVGLIHRGLGCAAAPYSSLVLWIVFYKILNHRWKVD